ncbi:MFS transporter [Nocardia sp. NPDC005978]|uniref:MFS transporter n=1 Tax=Nocardia sp. NPDC005978 TaxID=3156725 RepID=UPI0033B01C20
MRGLTARSVLFALTKDLIPLYAVYALIFADHGLSVAQISSLLAIWSVTSFVLEVPSGAWADTVSRRALLILSAVLLAAGFAVWTLFPSYLGFAAGFVLWGTSGALSSGTFEALLYDDLAARAATPAYARILGYTRAAAESAALAAILAAAPLYTWGGYPLVGWSSVVVAALHILAAMAMPSAPKAVSAGEVEDLEDADEEDSRPGEFEYPRVRTVEAPAFVPESASLSRYLHMLRTGVREALRVRVIRRGVLLAALLNGITAYDEYFALMADEAGVSPAVASLLVGVTVAGALAGAFLSGRTESMRPRTMAWTLTAGGVLFIAGALLSGLAATHPASVHLLTGVGFTLIGVAYGLNYNADVIASARLQDAIEGPARATVTSVSGVATEVFALAVFVFAGSAATLLSISTAVALLGIPLLATALLATRWLPRSHVSSAPGGPS